jgi:hypothetical protein
MITTESRHGLPAVPSNSRRQKTKGYALPMVLVLSAISLLALSGALSRTSQSSMLNERQNQRQRSQAAAEAATEKVLGEIRHDFKIDGERRVYPRLANYRSMVPTRSEDPYWDKFQFTNPEGTADRLMVNRVSSESYVALNSKYSGLNGFASTYRVVANARQKDGTIAGVTNAVMQEVQLASIPIFQFAIFYNSLLEFTWAAPLTVRGRVHANGDIYTGSSAPLTLTEDITSTGIIKKRDWAGYRLGWMKGAINYQGTRETNVNSLTLPIATNNSASAAREILNMPPTSESLNSPMGQQRFFNKAEMTVVVTDSGVSVQVKKPFGPSPTVVPISAQNFVNTGKTFTDYREAKTVKVTEIDVAKMITWAATNKTVITKLGAGRPPNILYVADNRSTSSSELTGVRLINGRTLPSRGLTVATPNPLYVKGHYNQPDNRYLGTTNTINIKPASLISDALTILSKSWNYDNATSGGGNSGTSLRSRVAVNTTVNAAILTGIVYAGGLSGTRPKSGGIVNLPRLLENWGNGRKRLTLNGSLVNLFNSARATAPFRRPGYYYYAPTRDFNFDPNFRNVQNLPPGTPELRTMIRGEWATLLPGQSSNP